MHKIVVIGAGKTGRGFLGRLLAEADREILFIDRDEELVQRLNQEKSFPVHFFGGVREDFAVSGYHAVTWTDADFADVGLILVSVGGQNLEEVGACLGEKLAQNRHYDIITCENSSRPAEVLRRAIGDAFDLSVSESTVFCTTIETKDELLGINSENYPYLQCNQDLLPGFTIDIPGIRPEKNFGNFLTRKLYTYNAASCVLAYLGAKKGYTDYREAGRDAEILDKLDQNYQVTNQVLCEAFGYEKQDQEEFAKLSREKFTNQTIEDTIARNARDPQRKLGSDERIIGPAKLILAHGILPEVLIETAAAAICYEGDASWNTYRETHSVEAVLTEVCGLQPGESLYEEIRKACV